MEKVKHNYITLQSKNDIMENGGNGGNGGNGNGKCRNKSLSV
jgi:hypothetical protein